MFSTLKQYLGSWEQVRNVLFLDIQHIESAANQRHSKTFTDTNILLQAARAPEMSLSALNTTYPRPDAGQTANVNDSTTATWGATVTGGGTNRVAARWNGTAWTVTGK